MVDKPPEERPWKLVKPFPHGKTLRFYEVYGLAHPKHARMVLLNFQCLAMGTSLFPPIRRLEDDSGSSRRNHMKALPRIKTRTF